MPAPYDSPWQASTYSLHDTQYRPTQGPSAYLYPPPSADYSHERSNPSNPQPYDPPYPVAKPPQTMNGASLRGRTPSPTPSELKELNKGAIDWKAMSNWRFWIRKEWAWYYVALVIILVLTALMTLYHKQIVHWLTPVTKWLHDLPFGWVVPIAVLFVISFPPLFGHEIVAILCGLVWGLWIGFGIVAAGTFLGEVGNFYAFKYCCRSRGEKLERTNLSYACLAKVVRDGGFKIALIARLSAIPGHFTTAIFSTCGMGIIVFSIAAILSMPKQFITVYLGVILEQSADGTQDTKSRIISDVVLAITILITALAMWYILREMNKVKPDVIYAKRKARQAKIERQFEEQGLNSHAFEHGYINSSESDIPLTSRAMPMGQAPSFPQPTHFQGHSSESVNEPPLHAPRPHRVGVQVPHVGSDEELTSQATDHTQCQLTGNPIQLNLSHPPIARLQSPRGLADRDQLRHQFRRASSTVDSRTSTSTLLNVQKYICTFFGSSTKLVKHTPYP
ncbi:Golgi apparatus membrane protein TVP38 [Leucoagaricus sp. SymC.cos]|nr:Golgi apparatus membrane protein TVP38 [Leucoagaricus sp. SymC.cos]